MNISQGNQQQSIGSSLLNLNPGVFSKHIIKLPQQLASGNNMNNSSSSNLPPRERSMTSQPQNSEMSSSSFFLRSSLNNHGNPNCSNKKATPKTGRNVSTDEESTKLTIKNQRDNSNTSFSNLQISNCHQPIIALSNPQTFRNLNNNSRSTSSCSNPPQNNSFKSSIDHNSAQPHFYSNTNQQYLTTSSLSANNNQPSTNSNAHSSSVKKNPSLTSRSPLKQSEEKKKQGVNVTPPKSQTPTKNQIIRSESMNFKQQEGKDSSKNVKDATKNSVVSYLPTGGFPQSQSNTHTQNNSNLNDRSPKASEETRYTEPDEKVINLRKEHEKDIFGHKLANSILENILNQEDIFENLRQENKKLKETVKFLESETNEYNQQIGEMEVYKRDLLAKLQTEREQYKHELSGYAEKIRNFQTISETLQKQQNKGASLAEELAAKNQIIHALKEQFVDIIKFLYQLHENLAYCKESNNFTFEEGDMSEANSKTIDNAIQSLNQLKDGLDPFFQEFNLENQLNKDDAKQTNNQIQLGLSSAVNQSNAAVTSKNNKSNPKGENPPSYGHNIMNHQNQPHHTNQTQQNFLAFSQANQEPIQLSSRNPPNIKNLIPEIKSSVKKPETREQTATGIIERQSLIITKVCQSLPTENDEDTQNYLPINQRVASAQAPFGIGYQHEIVKDNQRILSQNSHLNNNNPNFQNQINNDGNDYPLVSFRAQKDERIYQSQLPCNNLNNMFSKEQSRGEDKGLFPRQINFSTAIESTVESDRFQRQELQKPIFLDTEEQERDEQFMNETLVFDLQKDEFVNSGFNNGNSLDTQKNQIQKQTHSMVSGKEQVLVNEQNKSPQKPLDSRRNLGQNAQRIVEVSNPVNQIPKVQQRNSMSQNSEQNFEDKQNNCPNSEQKQEVYVAIQQFKGKKENDLNFDKGDKIQILRKTKNGWWIGLCQNNIGYFPSNTVSLSQGV